MSKHLNNLQSCNIEQDEEVVISGISGKFPQCDNIREFSEKLLSGEDMVIPNEKRLPLKFFGLPKMGTLKEISKFDAQYFEMTGKQADTTDPIIRILLELTYEAIVDAGFNPEELKGTKTAVIIGASDNTGNLWNKSREVTRDKYKYILTGHAKAMYANRISYNFHFQGPSYQLDAACSSACVALYNAVHLIRSGECDAAIIGGCHLCTEPYFQIQMNQLQMLSPDGRCKAFDANGNGYARSDAVGVIFIQKKSVVRRMYCSIAHIGINSNGFKVEGVTFPSRQMQAELLKKVYSEAKIDPSTVEYVEAHGLGTKVDDQEEVSAISEVLCGKDRTKTLLVGSVKSNVGHTDAGSGVCAIAKVLLTIQRGQIPPNLHYNNPNKNIPALFDGSVKVVDKITPYNGGLIAVNSFGFGGTNVHMLLKPNLKRKHKNHLKTLPQLVTVSGRTENSVRNFLKKIEQSGDIELNQMIRVIHRENMKNHFYRGFGLFDAEQPVTHISTFSEEKRPVWFIFSGLGAHWPGMGKDLTKFTVFDDSLRNTSSILDQFGLNLYELVVNKEYSVDNMIKLITGTVAVQIALVDLLRFLNIRPDGIFGHSTGEIAASYADGAMTAVQAILCAYYRGKSFMEANLPLGAMASVGLSWAQAEARCPAGVYPACDNSADNVTISGPPEPVKQFVQTLQSEKIFAKEVDSLGGAYHTKYVTGSAELLRKYINDIIPNPKKWSSCWVSTSIPESQWDSDLAQSCSPAYQVNNMISPVYFRNAMTHIPGNAVVVEVGPHCLFQSILKRSLPSTCVNIGLVNKNYKNKAEFFLSSVGKMYTAGLQPQIDALYPEVTFPVSVDTPTISDMVEWDHSDTWTAKLYQETEGSLSMYNEMVLLTDEKDSFLSGHTIDGHVLYPATGYLVLAWKCLAKVNFKKMEEIPVKIWNVKIHQATVLPPSSNVIFDVNYLKGTKEFDISESGSLIVSGNISVIENPEMKMVKLQSTPERSTVIFNSDDLYKEFRLRGYEYSGQFQGICRMNSEGTSGTLKWNNNWVTFIDTILQTSIVSRMEERVLALPTEIQSVIINPQAHKSFNDGDNISVKINKELRVIQAGGVEIRNLKTTVTQHKPDRGPAPKLEKYLYTPYISGPELKGTLNFNDSLAITLQIVIENLKGLHTLNVTEFAENKSPKEIIMPNIADVLLKETIKSPKLNVIVQNTSEFLKTDKNASLGINYLEMKSLNHPEIKNTDVLVGSHAMSGEVSDNKIFEISDSLKPGAFIILEVPEEIKIADTVNGFLVVYSQSLDSKQILLLRKPTHAAWKKIVHYTENNFNWIDDLKEALRESEPTNEIVVVVSSGEKESGIIGLMNCLRLEPGGKNLRCIFAPSKKLHESSIEDSFYKEVSMKDLFMNVHINNSWGSYRYVGMNAGTVNTKDAYVNTVTPGDLSSLKWIQAPHVQDENLCYVYYASLNFRDCMLATNRISIDTKKIGPQDSVLGFEFCGRNKQGERVMGVIETCALATKVMADPIFTWKVPNHWTMEQAATVPAVYLTVYYALILKGNMKPGQSILIHAGAGGVGIAAITIALTMNATVYTTVSTKEKREFLKQRFPQLNDRNIANSRDTTFEQHVLQETRGKGVDLVLNSLAEDKLIASADCLGQNGKFLEIGKYDILQNSPLGMEFFQKNTTFYGIFLDHIITGDHIDVKKRLSNLLQEGLDSGIVEPLPAIVYSSSEAEQAFRFLASGKHMGKVMIKIRDEESEKIVSSPRKKIMEAIPRTYFREDKVYIIIGGLGGMGLQLADWMITRGAKNLVLTSRTGIKNGYQSLCISRWKKMGINITVSTADCTSKCGITQLIEGSSRSIPVGGIFNLAVVLKDASFQNQCEKSFVECCVPKADVTKLLDEISREHCPQLDYFVVFSSVSCGRGNPGQTNYGLANSTMERICELRRSEGLPGLAIQWGPVGDVGIFAETLTGNVRIKELLPQRIASCLKTLDIFLGHSHPVVSSIVLADKSTVGKTISNVASPVEIVANILGINNINDISPDKTLTQMGVDSLMISEIKQIFERNFNVSLNVDDIRNLDFAEIEKLASSENTEETFSTPQPFIKLESRPENLLPIQVPTDVIIKLPSKTTDGSTNINIFIVHPVQGVVSMLKPLACQLSVNVYGLQLTSDTPLGSIQSVASHYIKHIKSIQEKGPYLISGYSYGVIIALEIGIQLENAGEDVSLVLLDGALKTVVPFMKFEEKLWKNMQNEKKVFLASLLLFTLLCGGIELMKYLNHMLTLQSNEQCLEWVVELVTPAIQCSKEQVEFGIKNVFNLLNLADTYSPKSKFSRDVMLIKSTYHALAETFDDPYDLQPVCEKKIIVLNLNASHEDIIQNEETVKKIEEIFTLVISKM